MRLIKLFLQTQIILYSLFVNSQSVNDTINELEEVVITATRTPKRLDKVALPTSVISKEQIRTTGTTRLRDILLEQTGITIVSDFGNSEGIQVQGMDAEYTLILIDGQPCVGRTSGNIDLNRISVNNIKRVEVVKGASSSLYGSEALAGVINIITDSPRKEQSKGQLSYMTRLITKKELDINGSYTYNKGKIGLVSNFNLNSGSGYDLTPVTKAKTAYPHNNMTGNVKFRYQINDKLDISTSGRYFKEKFYDNEGKGLLDDSNYVVNINQSIAKKVKLKYNFYSTNYKTQSLFNGDNTIFDQRLYQGEIKTDVSFKKSTLIAGVGYRFDALKRSAFDGEKKYNSKYIYAQYDFHPIKKLNLVLGTRYEDYNKFKDAFNPKLAARYELNKQIAIKSSVGFGYKVPDFRQVFFNFRNRDQNYIVLGTQTLHELYGDLPEVQKISKKLKPESSTGFNTGVQVKFHKLTANINFFRNDVKNFINYFTIKADFPDLPKNKIVFSYENRSKIQTQGIEFDMKYKFNNNLNLLLGYQFLKTKDLQEVSQLKGNNVFYRPTKFSSAIRIKSSDYFGLANRSNHSANFKLFYKNYEHNFSANLRTIFRSKYAIRDNNGNNLIDKFDNFVKPYSLTNINIQKEFYGFIDVQFGIDNIFNEKGDSNKINFKKTDIVLQLGTTFYTKFSVNF